jgi:hypothetical protein
MINNRFYQLTIIFYGLLLSQFSIADEADEMAKKLANPIAALISVPIQANYDKNLGPDDKGSRWTTKIQPVIPFSIGENWNVISRTILPIIDQEDIPVNGESNSGIGDTVQSFFFSPKQPTESGWIWGAGPVFLLDTASDDNLGGEQWGAGPTVVALKQQGPWTMGMLANHIESFAGENDRDDVSATYMQPFLAYITHTKTTFSVSSESTYDWENNDWSVPIIISAKQMLKVGDQLFQVGGGLRYWAESPTNGAEDWGFRMELIFLFPK